MNGHKVEIHAQARIDLYDQVDYLATRESSLETVLAFILEMEESKTAIARNPLTWPFARRSRLVRRYGPTKKFRYLVYYVAQKGGVPRIIEFSGPGRQPRWVGRL